METINNNWICPFNLRFQFLDFLFIDVAANSHRPDIFQLYRRIHDVHLSKLIGFLLFAKGTGVAVFMNQIEAEALKVIGERHIVNLPAIASCPLPSRTFPL